MLRFGSEDRSFAHVRLRKVVYEFRLDALMGALRVIPFQVPRRPKKRHAGQLNLPGTTMPQMPRPGTRRVVDVTPLLSLMLMRAAESSPRALERSR